MDIWDVARERANELGLFGQAAAGVGDLAVSFFRRDPSSVSRAIESALRRYTRTAPRYQGGELETRFGQKLGIKRGLPVTQERPTQEPRELKRIRQPDMGTVKDKGGFVQFQKLRKEYAGRKIGYDQKLKKMLSAHLGVHVERFADTHDANYATAVESGTTEERGATFLSCVVENAVGNKIQNAPIYLYDLTSILNPFEGAAGPYYPYVKYGVQRDNNGNWLYQRFPLSSNGATRVGWTNEVLPRALDYTAGDEAFIEWVDVRGVVWGAQKKASTVYMEIWQFIDESIAPNVFADSNIATGGTVVSSNHNPDGDQLNEFWDMKASSYVGYGLNVQPKYRGTGYRVLYSKKFMFNPTESTEGDVSGHNMRFHLKYDINKLCQYNDGASGRTAQDNVNYYNPEYHSQVSIGKQVPWVAPKGAVYLVFRADVLKPAPATATDANLLDMFPSYDLNVRRKRSNLKL